MDFPRNSNSASELLLVPPPANKQQVNESPVTDGDIPQTLQPVIELLLEQSIVRTPDTENFEMAEAMDLSLKIK